MSESHNLELQDELAVSLNHRNAMEKEILRLQSEVARFQAGMAGGQPAQLSMSDHSNGPVIVQSQSSQNVRVYIFEEGYHQTNVLPPSFLAL